jgi:hypothetical protein
MQRLPGKHRDAHDFNCPKAQLIEFAAPDLLASGGNMPCLNHRQAGEQFPTVFCVGERACAISSENGIGISGQISSGIRGRLAEILPFGRIDKGAAA